ncbi:MAG: hypothetical protein ACK4YV_06180 [Emticicia sp.]
MIILLTISITTQNKSFKNRP